MARPEPIDPGLQAAVAQLVAQGHKPKDIIAAALAAGKRRVFDASDGKRRRLAELIDQLRYPEDVFQPFAFVQRCAGGGIPEGVTIEVLERLAAKRRDNPWAFINYIMRQDYPNYKWGRQ